MLSKLLTILALAAMPALAQYEVKDGYCEQGGQQVQGPGNQLSTTRVQRSYPSCTVQVTLSAGGAATIFSDSTGTPLANPFTAATNGYYFFFIAPNTHFDVTISGGGLTGPITHSYYILGNGSAGGGTITSINSQAGPTITIAAGTAGTDFAVAQAGNTITLNLPTASATNRGALSTTDWNTFNAKESALTFSAPLSRVTNTISLSTVAITLGGTGQTSKLAAFNALSPLTTKGDVIGFNGTDNVRLAAGANNSCLIADSTQATGLRYDSTCHMAIGGTITSSTSGSLLYVSAGLLAQSLVSGGGIQCLQVDNSGVPTGTGSPCAGTGANVVKTDQSNTYSTGNQDFRNATAFELPVSAGGTTTTNGGALYDSTGNQVHFAVNLTDRIMVYRSNVGTPTPGNCVQWGAAGIVSDTGSACGSGGSGITELTGDVTAGPGSGVQAAMVVNLPSGVTQAGFLRATAIVAPGTPVAGVGAIYVDSSSKNLAVKDDAGVVKHGIQTDTGTANNYISAISDAGAITKSRPACATLSDSGTGCSAAAGITQLTGDVTAGAGSGSQAATVVNLPTGVTQAGYLAATAIVAPATPGAGVGRIYVDSTSKNLSVKDDAGIVKHGVQTQAAVASNWIRAISDAGGVTVSQPAIADLSDGSTVVKGAASLSTSGTVPYVASAGTLNQDSLFTWDSTNHCLNVGSAVAVTGCGTHTPIPLVYLLGSATNAHAFYQLDCTTSISCDASVAFKNSGAYSWSILLTSPLASDQLQIQDNGASTLPFEIQKASPTDSLVITPTGVNVLGALKLGSSPPSVTPGTGGVPFACVEGTAPSVGAAAGVDIVYCDSTAHKPLLSNNNGSYFAISQTIASGAKALATAAISSAACTAAQTDTATGTLTTDVVTASFNGDPTAVTGYVPLTTGMLTIIAYPTADTVNFKVCNNTSASITPGAITLNWKVSR